MMQSWIFSTITPFFSVTWSFRNHSWWFAAQETFIISSNVFLQKPWYIFSWLFDKLKVQKISIYLK